VSALRQAAYLLARASEAALAMQRLTPRLARAAAAATAAAAVTGAQALPAPMHTRTASVSGGAASATTGREARAADRWLLLRVHARSAVARALVSGCPPAGLAAASPRFLGRGLAPAAPLQRLGAAAHAAAALAAPSLLSSIAPAAAAGAGAAGSRGKSALVRKAAARAAAAAAASSTACDGSRSAEARVVVYRPTPHRRYSPVGPGSVPRFLEYVAAQQAERAEAERAEKARALVAAAADSQLKRTGSDVMLRLWGGARPLSGRSLPDHQTAADASCERNTLQLSGAAEWCSWITQVYGTAVWPSCMTELLATGTLYDGECPHVTMTIAEQPHQADALRFHVLLSKEGATSRLRVGLCAEVLAVCARAVTVNHCTASGIWPRERSVSLKPQQKRVCAAARAYIHTRQPYCASAPVPLTVGSTHCSCCCAC